MFYQT